MKIEKILKKEGIELVSTLDSSKVNIIAERISKRICKTFPEHNINQNDLYTALSKVNMYFADFEDSSVGAKYYYKNSSIYFNRKFDIKKLSDLSLHECIHFIQEKKSSSNKLERMGLFYANTLRQSGLNLNEAAVQLMTVQLNNIKPDYVKYYGLSFYSPSPDYYPIECTLLNQIVYFIGSFPLYHSTLYSDDVFKTTFITKTNKKTYYFIENSFDLLANYETELSKLIYSLANNSDESIINLLNNKIATTKENIAKLTIKIQERIIKECFYPQLEKIKNLNDIDEIKKQLLNFKKYLIQTENYDFYNLFTCEILGKLEEKTEFIKNHGIQSYYEKNSTYLPILASKNYGVNLFNIFIAKTKLLFKHINNKESNVETK